VENTSDEPNPPPRAPGSASLDQRPKLLQAHRFLNQSSHCRPQFKQIEACKSVSLTHICRHTHTHTCSHTHTHMLAHTCTRSQARAHTHTQPGPFQLAKYFPSFHVLSLSLSLSLSLDPPLSQGSAGELMDESVCVRVCVRACVYVCACVRACVCVCV